MAEAAGTAIVWEAGYMDRHPRPGPYEWWPSRATFPVAEPRILGGPTGEAAIEVRDGATTAYLLRCLGCGRQEDFDCPQCADSWAYGHATGHHHVAP